MDWMMIALIINVVLYSIVAVCAGIIWYDSFKLQNGGKKNKK